MKTIIAGSRDFNDYDQVLITLSSLDFQVTEIVSGCCRGPDQLGEMYAKEYKVPVKKFPADWNQHGKAAGPIRNRQMAEYSDALVAFWDHNSRGTKNMIDEARKRNKTVVVVPIKFQPA